MNGKPGNPISDWRNKTLSVKRPIAKISKSGKRIRLGVISNPLSGGNRSGLGAIRDAVGKCDRAWHVEATNPREVGIALERLAGEEIDVLAVNGGDGTIHAVLTEMFRRPDRDWIPVLAVLRSGTTSLIARDVGLKGSRKRGLRKLLKWIDTGAGVPTVVKRPLLKVTGVLDQGPLYGMFFGAAGICQGIQFFHAQLRTKGLRGQFAAGLAMARFILAAAMGNQSLIPVHVTVGLDEEPQEERAYAAILISTLERLFFRLRPFWGVENAPVYYTALRARPRHLLRAFPPLLLGRISPVTTTENGYFSRNITEARLAYSGSLALDGELYPVDDAIGEVTVKKGGKALFLQL